MQSGTTFIAGRLALLLTSILTVTTTVVKNAPMYAINQRFFAGETVQVSESL
jgi:hypothetical protein